MEVSESEAWARVYAGALGGILGVIGTVLTATIAWVVAIGNMRIHTLTESYEKRIGNLEAEISRLETENKRLEGKLAAKEHENE